MARAEPRRARRATCAWSTSAASRCHVAAPSPARPCGWRPETARAPARAAEGRRARDRAARRDHGREADERADPALPSAAAHARRRRRSRSATARVEITGVAETTAQTGVEMEALDGRVGRRADGLRHGEGDRHRACRRDESALVEKTKEPRVKAAVVTVSDGVSAGEREDESGDASRRVARGGAATRSSTGSFRTFVFRSPPTPSRARAHVARHPDDGRGRACRRATSRRRRRQSVLDRWSPGSPRRCARTRSARRPTGLLGRGTRRHSGTGVDREPAGSPGGCRDGFALIKPALPHAIRADRRRAVRAPADMSATVAAALDASRRSSRSSTRCSRCRSRTSARCSA